MAADSVAGDDGALVGMDDSAWMGSYALHFEWIDDEVEIANPDPFIRLISKGGAS